MVCRSLKVRVLASGITLACGMLAAQSRRIEDLGAGKLLVMEGRQGDPLFAESVILLIHYDTDGVVGLRLNQPSDVPLSRLREVKGTGRRSDPVCGHVDDPRRQPQENQRQPDRPAQFLQPAPPQPPD